MKGKIWVIIAALLVAAGLFFLFGITGHMYVALVCFFIAAVTVLYRFGGRKLKIAASVVIAAGLVLFAVLESPVIRDARTDAPEDCKYVVVLGAGVRGTVPSLSLTNRLQGALDWLEAHPDCIAIVSGGQGEGEDITESLAMRLWLEERGVAPERIIEEPLATSTEENLRFSFDIIRALGDEPEGNTAALSSEYHLCRAKLVAQTLGVPVYGVAARTTMPTLMMNYFIREALAVTYYKLWGDMK